MKSEKESFLLMAQTERKHRLRPGYGYEAGQHMSLGKRAAFKLRGPVRTRLIAALETGATIEEACEAAGVTTDQLYYRRNKYAAFDLDCRRALKLGLSPRLMPPETRKRFLFICSWFGVIDLARECCYLQRRDLARVFKADGELREEAMAECKRASAFNGCEPTRQEFSIVAMRERLLPMLAAMDEFD